MQLELQVLLFFFFSLSFKAETAQRSLMHVIWKYCDNWEIGLVSRKTTVAVSFLLFLKAILIFQALWGKSLLNIPLWGRVLILAFLFSLMSGTSSRFFALCLHSAFFPWGFAPRFWIFGTKALKKGEPVPLFHTFACDYRRQKSVWGKESKSIAYVTQSAQDCSGWVWLA